MSNQLTELNYHGFPSIGKLFVYSVVLAFLSSATPVWAQTEDFTDKSIFELMDMEISIVNAKRDSLFESAAAVTVITQEQIRRSGYLTLVDVLRTIPGFHIGAINDHKWSVSARGFGGRWSSKLLVLMDGRTLYSPIFGGMYWDMQTTALNNIEKIEVIRGPGASIWGSNSVSGVINIVTKTPDNDKPQANHQLTGQFGNKEDYQLSYQSDGSLLDDVGYRLNLNHTAFGTNTTHSSSNQSEQHKNEMQLTLQWLDNFKGNHKVYLGIIDGDQLTTSLRPMLSPPFFREVDSNDEIANNYVNYRYMNELSTTEHLEFQLIYDHSKRVGFDGHFDLDTWEGKYNQARRVGRHSLHWGLGYRHQQDEFVNNFVVSMLPAQRQYKILSGFIQDEIHFDADKGEVSLGVKYENASHFADQLHPSLRVSYLTDPDTSWWTVISQAYRSPTRSEQDMQLNLAVFPGQFGQLTVLQILGNPSQRSEKLQAWEFGVRKRFEDELSIDVSAFYHDYDRLLSSEPLPPYCYSTNTSLPCESSDAIAIASQFGNGINGTIKGLEVQVDYRINEQINLTTSLSVLTQGFAASEHSLDNNKARQLETSVPKRSIKTRLDWDITEQLQWTMLVYYSSALESQLNTGTQRIDSHWRFDTRLGWEVANKVEVYISGKNVFDPQHIEYTTNDGTAAANTQRSLGFGFDWRF